MVEHQRAARLLTDAELRRLAMDPPAEVHHYTSVHGLVSMLRERALRLSDSRFLNDRVDGRFLLDVAEDWLRNSPRRWRPSLDAFREYREIAAGHGGATFIVSFSERGDDLLQWMAYGERGRGFRVTFDTARLKSATDRDESKGAWPDPDSRIVATDKLRFGRVLYGEVQARRFVTRVFAQLASKLAQGARRKTMDAGELARSAVDTLREVAPFFKHGAFQEEREWRAVLHADWPDEIRATDVHVSDGRLVPDVRVPLASVIAESGSCITAVMAGPAQRGALGEPGICELLRLARFWTFVPGAAGPLIEVSRSELPLR